jgi:hypothetical protein
MRSGADRSKPKPAEPSLRISRAKIGSRATAPRICPEKHCPGPEGERQAFHQALLDRFTRGGDWSVLTLDAMEEIDRDHGASRDDQQGPMHAQPYDGQASYREPKRRPHHPHTAAP